MPRVSAKRQITLPMDQCRQAGIEPGDEYESFVDHNGHITIIRKEAGAAEGLLKDLQPDPNLTDEDSLQDAMHDRH
ncbi:AbrB/MazE/SpoVT family DNA-binding domain-containing protein [Endozoicomonas numazuensis]|uniref:AbrB family transcriptional regulator n=1 Tax=Endozoicomonas numazuensis TaxID=1137799 RepID=A0A081NCV4_9GAMM|nr:AbrB/MazE/SpoVT family DNA-binding domain-containing protein [Endozoicomonas numazuensis]KEQ16277.1 AbrB family transcriptional regulator [Endozoicomonas numazuensis]